MYENKLINQIKDDPKRFWNYTRHFSRSSSTVDMLEHQDKKVSEYAEKATILNDYFISVLTKEPDILSSLPDVTDANPDHILEDFTVTTDIVRKKLLRLKANRASGQDQISVNVLRNCPNFALPLTHICNVSIQSGTLPQDWRDAHVSPIHKKGSTVQITFIFIGQTHLVFGKRVCTCVTKHSNAFRTFLNWLKNSKRVWHERKLHILRLPIFANFDL